MSRNEVMALKDSALNLKNADKGTTVIMNKTEKNRRGQSATRQQTSQQTSQITDSKKHAEKG